MFQNTYHLLKFVDRTAKIKGRKRLQKMIHLLSSSGVEFTFKYRYHHYGPYSAELQYEMDQLVTQGYIDEEFVDGAYNYSISGKGLEFKQLLEEDGQYHLYISNELFEELMAKETSFLEILSTYVFLRNTGQTEEEARSKAVELKPHLSTYIERVISDYKRFFTV